MNGAVGRLIAAGNIAEVFEWGSRVPLKLHAEEIAGSCLDAYCRIRDRMLEKILDWLPQSQRRGWRKRPG